MRACLLALCLCLAAGRSWAGAAAASAPVPGLGPRMAPDLVLEVRLGPHLLSDGLGAWQQGDDVLLPLGELARLLTLAVRTDPGAGRASGYLLDEHNGFELDLARAEVAFNGQRQPVQAALVRSQSDDIYVAARLLALWLPVDLELDLASLSLTVRPRARLPVQARFERAGRPVPRSSAPAPAFPLQHTPYALAGTPFIDQTIGVELARARGSRRSVDYTGYASGDLAGMEAALFLNLGQQTRGPAARLTLGRHDPDAGLLGPLRARTVEVGHVAMAGIDGIVLGGAAGKGLAISNRPLGLPTGFDRHSIEGDLAPGWDVELYFNGALVGTQQARADGRYSFSDQALVYGPNEFRLVFHGPLGQLRIERHSFLLEQSLLAPGELQYSVVAARADARPAAQRQASARIDLGLTRQLSIGGGIVQLALDGAGQRYAHTDLRTYWQGAMIDAGAVRMQDGGMLRHLGINTRFGDAAVAARRSRLRDFASAVYPPSADPVLVRDDVRLDAVAAGMPITLQARRERLASGALRRDASARLSLFRQGMALTNALRWTFAPGLRQAGGLLQGSRRSAGYGVGGQLHYTLAPQASIDALALTADRYFGQGYQLSAGIARTFADAGYRFSIALNKSLGRFGLGVTAQASSQGSYSAGLVLFAALGREPRSGRWISDAAPMAGAGAVSALVFLDKNMNGIMDGDDQAIPGAGFTLNGASALARTGADGVAWLGRLPAGQHLDVGFDAATLEDPQWQPRAPGIRIVPRPGKVNELLFAVAVTGEIDGSASVLADGTRRGAAGLEIELLDAAGALAASTRSGADGYYLLSGVAPGRYLLRVAPAQLARLQLRAGQPQAITIDRDGSFVNGRELVLVPDALP